MVLWTSGVRSKTEAASRPWGACLSPGHAHPRARATGEQAPRLPPLCQAQILQP